MCLIGARRDPGVAGVAVPKTVAMCHTEAVPRGRRTEVRRAREPVASDLTLL